jgi:hypothetical protein
VNREFNPFDILIGFGLGIAMSLIGLRLAGLVGNDVSIWGQVLIVPAMILVIARQMNRPPFVKKQESECVENHNG